MFHIYELKNYYYIYVTNQQMHIDKIYLSYIAIYQHVLVVSATIMMFAETIDMCS